MSAGGGGQTGHLPPPGFEKHLFLHVKFIGKALLPHPEFEKHLFLHVNIF
jgi:hypothetical protein